MNAGAATFQDARFLRRRISNRLTNHEFRITSAMMEETAESDGHCESTPRYCPGLYVSQYQKVSFILIAAFSTRRFLRRSTVDVVNTGPNTAGNAPSIVGPPRRSTELQQE